MKTLSFSLALGMVLAQGFSAAPLVVTEQIAPDQADSAWRFTQVAVPVKNDAATSGVWKVIAGQKDPNSPGLAVLSDAKVPATEDVPAENFFFQSATDGGRLTLDLKSSIAIKEINTFSWHPTSRGAQLYQVYGSDGMDAAFKAEPSSGDPSTAGWTLLASVNTRPADKAIGGQHAASIRGSEGKALGNFRHLLFVVKKNETPDGFGNTFFSEIDVVDANGSEKLVAITGLDPSIPKPKPLVVTTSDGKSTISLDTSEAPDLAEWVGRELAPVVTEWYPKLVALLPSEGFSAPTNVLIVFKPDLNGVPAFASGNRISVNAKWYRTELNREAKGCVIHELVHVVQQYGYGRVNRPKATRTPGWVVEGVPDYIRWYLFEPQSKGAEISERNLARAKFDGNYRITANFLNYVVGKYDKDFVTKLNDAARNGQYSADLWTQHTGKSVEALDVEWRASLADRLGVKLATAALVATTGVVGEPPHNQLSEADKQAGWKLLFNGKDLTGWSNFKTNTVLPGWQVKDGALVCADPSNAKDLVTSEKFGWFELELEYNISEGGNSGIIYHVSDKGHAVWASGPEFQLEDNVKAKDPTRCGWLYGLYTPPIDEKTGKPLDATKPVGQWNKVRLVISPEKCEHIINGVKYFEYNLDSEDFKQRVAKSKFARMPLFAKEHSGFLALQGDHGSVSFRNIRIRTLK